MDGEVDGKVDGEVDGEGGDFFEVCSRFLLEIAILRLQLNDEHRWLEA